MKLSEDLQWRGQIKDRTFDDVAWLDQPRTFYLGTDCSANSLTIGNLAVYMLARRMVKAGWKAVLLVGGATSLVGDPGGKTSERELKDAEEITRNVAGITAQVSRFLGNSDITVVNNYDWFKDIGYLGFLRDVGKHYSMSELMQRDFVIERTREGGSGLSYAEFSYSIIQGYDYLHLFQEYHVELQIGGSDQWGNMLSGVPLIRKKCDAEVHALSMPLVINKATGAKFGKSETGAIWLDPGKTSVYQFYQFWLNVDDEGAGEYLKIYTELNKPEIESILAQFKQNPAGRLAQKTLAYEVTKLVHSQEKADTVQHVTDILFTTKRYDELTSDDYQLLQNELPCVSAKAGDDIITLIVQAGLASSNSEARRLLDAGGVYINQTQAMTGAVISQEDFSHGYTILRVGKNKNAIIKAT